MIAFCVPIVNQAAWRKSTGFSFLDFSEDRIIWGQTTLILHISEKFDFCRLPIIPGEYAGLKQGRTSSYTLTSNKTYGHIHFLSRILFEFLADLRSWDASRMI